MCECVHGYMCTCVYVAVCLYLFVWGLVMHTMCLLTCKHCLNVLYRNVTTLEPTSRLAWNALVITLSCGPALVRRLRWT